MIRASKGASCVRVENIGCEELQKAHIGALAGLADKYWQRVALRGGQSVTLSPRVLLRQLSFERNGLRHQILDLGGAGGFRFDIAHFDSKLSAPTSCYPCPDSNANDRASN